MVWTDSFNKTVIHYYKMKHPHNFNILNTSYRFPEHCFRTSDENKARYLSYATLVQLYSFLFNIYDSCLNLCAIMWILHVLSRCKWMWQQPMWWECRLCRHCWQFCLYMQRGIHWWSSQRMCWWVISPAVISEDHKFLLLYNGI